MLKSEYVTKLKGYCVVTFPPSQGQKVKKSKGRAEACKGVTVAEIIVGQVLTTTHCFMAALTLDRLAVALTLDLGKEERLPHSNLVTF